MTSNAGALRLPQRRDPGNSAPMVASCQALAPALEPGALPLWPPCPRIACWLKTVITACVCFMAMNPLFCWTN